MGCPGDPRLGSLMCILPSQIAYCTSRGKHKPGHGTWAQTQTLVCPDGLGMAGSKNTAALCPIIRWGVHWWDPRVVIIVGTFRGTSGKLVLVFDGNQKDSVLSLTILFSLPNKLILCNDSVQYKWKKRTKIVPTGMHRALTPVFILLYPFGLNLAAFWTTGIRGTQ